MKLKTKLGLKGFFTRINEPIWKDEVSSSSMDIDLLASYGEKETSPLFDAIISLGASEDEGLNTLANYIYDKYKVNWEHKYNILKAKYDLLKTIEFTEHESIKGNTSDVISYLSNTSNTEKGTSNTNQNGSLNKSGSISSLRIDDLTETNKNTGSNTQNTTNNQTSNTNENQGAFTVSDTLTKSGSIKENTTNSNIHDISGSINTTESLKNSHDDKSRSESSTNTTTEENGYLNKGYTNKTENQSFTLDGGPYNTTATIVDDKSSKRTQESIGPTQSSTNGNISEDKTRSENYTDYKEIDESTNIKTQTFDAINETHTIQTPTKTNTTEETAKGTNRTENTIDENNTRSNTGTQKTVENYDNYSERNTNTDKTTTTNEISGLQDDTTTKKGDSLIERDKVTSGDQGVRPSSDLLRFENDFWSSWNFVDEVIKDTANELTTLIYIREK